MANVSKQETRATMMRAVVELMDEGLAVSEISGLTVTEHCGVDKMYVNRYFEDLSGLFLETIQYLLTEQLGSMLSQDVFFVGGLAVDPNVGHAFRIASHLSGRADCHDRLIALARVVSNAYAKQLENNYGMDKKRALSEAKFGLTAMSGYLIFGHLLEVDPKNMRELLQERQKYLTRNS
jgi:AcrR family transcriptional regulator